MPRTGGKSPAPRGKPICREDLAANRDGTILANTLFLKGYLRLGGVVGDEVGADYKFGTTSVRIKVARSEQYVNRYLNRSRT